MRRSTKDHTAQAWRVHALAKDLELLDVWRFPIRIAAEVSLAEFRIFFDKTLADLQKGSGPAALLFRLRGWLGRIFGWDAEDSPDELYGNRGFSSAYKDEFEHLTEIRNETVHAFMHLGRIELMPAAGEASDWSPQMAIYVKPRGLLGRAYMALIGPFRHWIVYPSMMRAVERAWPAYAQEHGWPEARARK